MFVSLMKILLTGSNGIIGTQLLNELLINYPTAEIVVVNRRPNAFISDRKIESIELDFLTIDKSVSDSLFNRIRPDLFFHAAWDTAHTGYLNTVDNLKWEQISIMLIDSFYSAGGKRFVGIGSSIEYDWKLKNPFSESSSPLSGNKWLYGLAKLNVFKHLSSLVNSSYLWCRVFFVFGPGQAKTRLVPLIINSAFNGGPPLKMNTDLQRDYISTFEIAKQIVMMQKTNYSGPVNICSGKAKRLGDIVQSVSRQTHKEIVLSAEKYPDNFELNSLEGSLDLMQKYYTGYEYSQYQFEKDILRTINAFQ